VKDQDSEPVSRVFRAEYGRAVSVLARVLGDLDAAQDAVQEAFTIATASWPLRGIPPSPAGWIITTARNRAIDQLRREATRDSRHAEAVRLTGQLDDAQLESAVPTQEDAVPDDRLRLIFTCCHPALAPQARVALTLRLLGGLSTAEIARAFLVPEPTMAQRIVRAKAKIRDARIPYRVPAAAGLPDRLPSVLSVIYLIFNEGYASSGDELIREGLIAEAVRLGRHLAELMPDEPEVIGLLGLMLLTQSRQAARTTPTGELVLLADQDRSRWDVDLISEGQALVRQCLRRNQPGPYQLQAAIAAVHSDAPIAAATQWDQIVQLYDQLLRVAPGSVVALNRAVAVAEVQGPEAGLELIGVLELDDYYLSHAVRADLLRRLERWSEAASAYGAAIRLAPGAAEQRFLHHRRDALELEWAE
jgi:RNA polymerase sigma-70 factor, ECF subfamily